MKMMKKTSLNVMVNLLTLFCGALFIAGIKELMIIVGNEALLNEPITQSVLIFSCFTIIGIISIWSYIFYIKPTIFSKQRISENKNTEKN